MSDVPTLTALIQTSVRALSAAYYQPAQLESALKYILGVDTALIQDGTYYLAEIGGQTVACGGWSHRRTLHRGDPVAHKDSLLEPAHEAAKIRAFFVHPDFARRGLGRRLMNACEAAAWQAGFHKLELLATLSGIPLYRACGFRSVVRHALQTPDGVSFPAVKMEKTL